MPFQKEGSIFPLFSMSHDTWIAHPLFQLLIWESRMLPLSAGSCSGRSSCLWLKYPVIANWQYSSISKHYLFRSFTLIISPSPKALQSTGTTDPLIYYCFIGNQPLSMCSLKVTLYHSQHLGNSKTLGRSVPETGMKTKYYVFLTINCNTMI